MHRLTSFAARIIAIAISLSTLSGSIQGAIYEVGPGHSLTNIGAVPWESLNAGDTVRIHWQAAPYREKWVICRQGTSNAPITIRGIPGPNGELPVIDGNAATTRPQLNFWNQQRGVIKIGGANTPPDTMPRYIVIENLDLRGGHGNYSFRAANGTTTAFATNAAAIYVEKAENLTIRNCVLHDSANGLFIGSSDAEPTRNILVEGNYIFGNGNVGSAFEHNNYTAAIDITFQFNRFGPLRTNAIGNNLKDRSAGLIVRYNWLEGGNRQLDLVDGEDSSAIRLHPGYRTTHVLGNVLVEPWNDGNRQIVHYGGDSGNVASYRKGTLHFYHNTVFSARTGRTVLVRLSTGDEHCDFRNNIVHATESAPNNLFLLEDAGRASIRNSWLKTAWATNVTGTVSVTNYGAILTGSAPGFLDASAFNFRLQTNSPCVDAGTNLFPGSPAAEFEYVVHQRSEPRRVFARADLGAYEFSRWAAWQHRYFGSFPLVTTGGEDADADADGLSNFHEYAFGSDPTQAFSMARPAGFVMQIQGTNYLATSFRRQPVPSGVTYQLQTSTNLIQWMDGSFYSDNAILRNTPSTTEVSDGVSWVVRANEPASEHPVKFLRANIRRE